MRQIWYLVGWGHQFVTPCLTQLAFPQVYIGLYSLPRRRWLFIYKWGCVSSFLLYLSELSFVIGITAEKINTATDNIYPQFLVGLPCKPGSPVKIPAIALGAIFFFLVIWGRLLSLAGACRWVMKKNCRITSFFVAHGNLAWAFPMLVGDIKHQQNQTSIHSQWSNLWPNCMDLYDSHLQEHWQAFYSLWLSVSHQNEHQVSLLPKHLLSLPRGIHVPLSPQNCASQLWPWQRGFFPHVYIHKGKFSPVVEKMNLT